MTQEESRLQQGREGHPTRVSLCSAGDKVRRLLARAKARMNAATGDTVDRERADFIEKYFHVAWPFTTR
jgi:hypothetical protein